MLIIWNIKKVLQRGIICHYRMTDSSSLVSTSNYDVFLTRDCLAYSKIKPAVNQMEAHPYFQRDSLVRFCQKHGVAVTAHTPLGGGFANAERFGSVPVLDEPVIQVHSCVHVFLFLNIHFCHGCLPFLQLFATHKPISESSVPQLELVLAQYLSLLRSLSTCVKSSLYIFMNHHV